MSQENVERLRALYPELARGNFRGTEELLAADVVFEPMSDGRRAYRGREAVAEQMREFLAQWSEFRIEAKQFVELGAAWGLREGKVVRARWDRASALEAARRLQGRRTQVSE
jgi:hypothetical protein